MSKAEIKIAPILEDVAQLKDLADRVADLSEPLQAVVKIIASAAAPYQPMPKHFEAVAAIEQVVELHELCRRLQGELVDRTTSEADYELCGIGRVTGMNNINAVTLVNDENVPWTNVFKPQIGEPVFVIRTKKATS